MDASLFLQYGWVFIVLVGLEVVLSADNAVVMAVMVKGLEPQAQKKALFYGLVGAMVLRFTALFVISLLVNMWYVQALGALYLLYLAMKHFMTVEASTTTTDTGKKVQSFWGTVLKVELSDIAFAIDSILAAAALVITLPSTHTFSIGGMDGWKFIVMFSGGFIGLLSIRFAATKIVGWLELYPVLEQAAFLLVGWVGVKLAVLTLAHKDIGVLSFGFPDSIGWQVTFWGVMIVIIIGALIKIKLTHQKG